MARLTYCRDCGHDLDRSESASVPFRSLPGVNLVGVPRWTCPSCGASATDIPSLAGLVRAIALTLVGKPSRLTGPEFRLLRNHLDWSSEECAHKLGVAIETLSRWEHGHQPVNAIADRFVRALVLVQEGVPAPVALLDLEFEAPGVPFRAQAIWSGQWAVEALDEDVRMANAEAARLHGLPAH